MEKEGWDQGQSPRKSICSLILEEVLECSTSQLVMTGGREAGFHTPVPNCHWLGAVPENINPRYFQLSVGADKPVAVAQKQVPEDSRRCSSHLQRSTQLGMGTRKRQKDPTGSGQGTSSVSYNLGSLPTSLERRNAQAAGEAITVPRMTESQIGKQISFASMALS